MTHDEEVRLRDYLERIIDERDRRYEDRFKAQETAVYAALSANRELTNAAFASSEKAIVKAEDAQRDYNQRSNEFRGQLDDQAKRLISREEVGIRFASVEDKIETRATSIEEKIDEVKRDINALRDFKSNIQGRIWAIGAVIGAVVAIVSLLFQYATR